MDSEHVSLAKLAAKRQIGTLRTQINFIVAHGKTSKEDVEQAHYHLQQEISRARFILRHLSTCIETSGDNPSDCVLVSTLQGLLEAAVIERSKLYEAIFGQQKKDSLKSFKQSINDLIERGEAPQWISTVTKEDVINHGQETNRLFQFLVEGQENSNGVPLVDSFTLSRASERTDLFTPKQCESLRKRSVKVEHLMLKETERLVQSLQEEEDLKPFLYNSNLSTNEECSNSSGWVCDQCTFQNEAGEDQCRAYNARQAESFLTVAERKPNKPIQKEAPLAAATKMGKAVLIKRPPVRACSTNTVWIPNKHVPEMIGPKGKHQRAMVTKSGALSIFAFQDKLDKDGMCPIEVQGSLEAFQKVVAMLEEKFTPKMTQTEHTKKEIVWIHNIDVPDMIGPRGATVQRLKAETGVKSITAWQELVKEDGMCPIDIRGHPEAVKKAATTIMNMFCGVTGQLLPVTTESASALASGSLRDQEVAAISLGSADVAGRVSDAIVDISSTVPSAAKPLSSISSKTKKMPLQLTEESAVPSNVVEPVCSRPTVSSLPTTSSSLLKSVLKVSSNDSPKNTFTTLFDFLKEHEKCLACSAKHFGDWLESVQISNLEEFAEALDDDDFVSLEMKTNGLKYFKRFVLQKAVAACLETLPTIEKDLSIPTSAAKKTTSKQEPPNELVCPIRHVLMTTDPVLATDGYTYEREAIESWLQRQGNTALSPMTNEPLVDVTLVTNVIIRTLARDWLRERSEE